MRLSNMADYAVVVMSAAARHCGGAKTSATELAEETGIALPTVQKLVSLLSKAGLIKSSRGAGGGIQLTRPAAAISMVDIIEAIEGPIAMTNCVHEAGHECALEDSCTVKPHWTPVNNAIKGALGAVTLASLAQEPVA